ncbi:MAG: hypothetical protein FWD69_18585 [Polyangiaceae bacterium]|nr:hypothetical protein [Polyangiaceae bacterium]
MMKSLRVAFFVGVALVALFGPRRAGAQSDASLRRWPSVSFRDAVSRANELIVAMEYDAARAELEKADPNDPAVVLAKARLALHEENCDLAVTLLGRAEPVQDDETRLLAEVARGCARVTAATISETDEVNGIVLRYQDEADRALGPLITDTVLKARASISQDLGVEWQKPTRVTIVRDLFSLSAMTGLPYASAQTTGTVAVAKWGRVTILSPRASAHGFALRDTLAHELTHLAISMQSRDRAPLWLHEGIARRQEARWREPGPFDDKPSVESVVLRGMELKLDLPLDKLGPSIAMLPSAKAAMVAFAEVTSFVRMLVDSSPPGTLAKLLVALRDAKTADDALRRVSGETLAQWDAKWRAQLAKRPREALSPLLGFGGEPPGSADARERARLAELLFGRGHPGEALTQLDKVQPDLLADPSLRHLRARVLERANAKKQAEALLEDPKQWIASFGPCWAVRGRLAREAGDEDKATASFEEAVAYDPLGFESACERAPGDEVAQNTRSDFGGALCDAARARNEPDIGQD